MSGVDFSRYWIRDPRFQVTLFTTHLIQGGEITFMGNMGTSVQMGSFCALLSIIFLFSGDNNNKSILQIIKKRFSNVFIFKFIIKFIKLIKPKMSRFV